MEHREHHRYAGHEIEISLLTFGPNRIRWIWRIDGLHVSKGRGTLESEELARSEALMYAQMMVAHLPRRAAEPAQP